MLLDKKTRCFGSHSELNAAYHDQEWGKPVHEDHLLFEMLILEGAQAGLSWETVLKRREEYKRVFYNFDPQKVAAMSDQDLEAILKESGVIRNRLKVFSTRQNAIIFLMIQKECGSFDSYLWQFVDFKPVQNNWHSLKDIPAKNALSDALSKDLQKRGMKFVGSTIIYAYMQAVGMVNDHILSCWLRKTS